MRIYSALVNANTCITQMKPNYKKSCSEPGNKSILDIFQNGGRCNGKLYRGGITNALCFIQIKLRNILREIGVSDFNAVLIETLECRRRSDNEKYKFSNAVGNIVEASRLLMNTLN